MRYRPTSIAGRFARGTPRVESSLTMKGAMNQTLKCREQRSYAPLAMTRLPSLMLTLLVAGLWLVSCDRRAQEVFELSDQSVIQAEKVFNSVQAADKEYRRLFAETRHPDDKLEAQAAQWFAERELMFNLTRIAYLDLSAKRSREALLQFVSTGWAFVQSPEGTFTRYDFADRTLKEGKDVYANMSQIESVVGEFRVFATSLVKEVK